MAASALKINHVPSNDVKNSLTDAQLLLLNHALLLVDVRYRERIMPYLAAWLQTHADLLPAYTTGLSKELGRIFREYHEDTGRDDERKDRLFGLAVHRFFRETGKVCAASEEVQDACSNRSLLEFKIAFGYLAMAWQAANFPKDIILTRHALTRRYPIEDARGHKPISVV